MPAILGLLSPILPYILLGIGVLAAYFGIKSKGKSEAKVEFQKQQLEVQKKVEQKVSVAVGKDSAVDAKVEAKIDEIKKQDQVPVAPPVDGGDFKF